MTLRAVAPSTLGCGPGRLFANLAMEFERVDGVDIAPEMLEVARGAGLPPNVHLTPSSGADLDGFPDDSFDLVLSLLVFQHVPDDFVVASTLSEIARGLKASGRAFIQFDSRPVSLGVRLGQSLPDALLPLKRRCFARRYRRSPEMIDAMLTNAQLRTTRESGRGSADHHIVAVRRAPLGP